MNEEIVAQKLLEVLREHGITLYAPGEYKGSKEDDGFTWEQADRGEVHNSFESFIDVLRDALSWLCDISSQIEGSSRISRDSLPYGVCVQVNRPRQWQLSVWVKVEEDWKPILFWGNSLQSIRDAACDWLRQNRPLYWSTTHPEQVKWQDYFYAYAQEEQPTREIFSGFSFRPSRYTALYSDLPSLWTDIPLTTGWHWITVGCDAQADKVIPEKLQGLEAAIRDFITHAPIKKGPDYQEIAMINGILYFPAIKSFKHEIDSKRLNDYLERGWYVLSQERWKNGRIPNGPEITVYILGHPEPSAT